MGVYTTPTQLWLAQRNRFTRVMHKQAEYHDELAKAGLEDFREATDGPLKSSRLRAMGHPYARTGLGQRGAKGNASSSLKGQVSRGMVRPLPINVQSGQLRRMTRLVGPSGAKREYLLGSWAAHAKFVLKRGGTKTMVDRGIWDHLKKRHKSRIAFVISEIRRLQAS
jgi:hypothetical protein